MKRVNFTVNGRTYHLACKPEEEAYFLELAAELDRRVADIAEKGEPMSESQALLIVAVSLLDELRDKSLSEQFIIPLEELTRRMEKLAKPEN